MTEATQITTSHRLAPARRWWLVIGMAVAVIALDQLSKRWALGRLSTGDVVDLIGSLRFRLAFNTGMAFSKGSGSGAIIGVVALGIVVPLLLQTLELRHRIPHTVLPALLVLAGGFALRWVMVNAGQASQLAQSVMR